MTALEGYWGIRIAWNIHSISVQSYYIGRYDGSMHWFLFNYLTVSCIFTDFLHHEFGNLYKEGCYLFIGKVRRCIADWCIGTLDYFITAACLRESLPSGVSIVYYKNARVGQIKRTMWWISESLWSLKLIKILYLNIKFHRSTSVQ
jgi:hypothetical protein